MSGFASPEMAATLNLGVGTISANQQIVFTKYIRVVLPLDGFVFWVKAELVSASSLINASSLNSYVINRPRQFAEPANAANEIIANGSLHYASNAMQEPDASYTSNQVIFTSETEVKDFNAVSPTVLYIGTWQGVRFSFSQRRSFYQQAGLYHYVGNAIYATMATQIIDTIAGFDTRNVIVSNSLPLWLGMNQLTPVYPYPASQDLTLYPAELVPTNLKPPYGAVTIRDTQAIQAMPYQDAVSSQWQLVSETVEITMYGYRNFNALDFVAYVMNLSVATPNDIFGIMNFPVIEDLKHPQVEMQVIAQAKRVVFEINYYQQRMRNFARQVITSCIPSFVTYNYPEYIASVFADIDAVTNTV